MYPHLLNRPSRLMLNVVREGRSWRIGETSDRIAATGYSKAECRSPGKRRELFDAM